MTPKRRAKGDGTLFQRRDGYWVGGVELPSTDGKRRYKRIVRKEFASAAKALKDLRKDVDAGRIPTTSTTTVQKWLEHWVETIQGPTVKPTTYRSYRDTVRLYINPTIGSKKLGRLTPEDVRQMHRTLQESSSRNAQKAHQVLQAALKSAENEGLVPRNVAAVVNKPRHRAAKRTSFSLGMAQHIIRTAETSSDETWTVRWILGFMLGAREGEVLGLTWDRVNLDEGWIDLSWQLQQLQKVHGCGEPDFGKSDKLSSPPKSPQYPCGRVRVSRCPQAHWGFKQQDFEWVECERTLVWTRPKSAAGTRIVPLLPELVVMLGRLEGGQNPHNLVFHHADGSPITPPQDQKAWKALLEAAKVDHVPQHTMRHSAATLLQAAGVDEDTRMQVLGHSSATATRGYIHVDRTQTRTALERLRPLLERSGQ